MLTSIHFKAVNSIRTLKTLIKFGLLNRWRESTMGPLWVIGNPLLTLFIHWYIFKNFMLSDETRYLGYLSGVLLPWLFLKTSLDVSVSSLSYKLKALKNFSCSPCLFNVSVVLEYFLHYFICSILLLGVSEFTNKSFFTLEQYLKAVPCLITFVVSVCALAHALSYLQVIYRDTKYLLDIGLRFLFLLSPILYLPSSLKNFSIILEFNPVYHMLRPLTMIYGGHEASLTFSYVMSFLMASVLTLLAWLVDKSLRQRIYEV